MKRVLTAVLLLVALTTTMFAQDAFYIYRNDGQFNAFFFDEVDSMAYSQYDVDSLYHDEYVVQDIFTSDSTYRIPLAVIDSIGFVQPEPVYKSDVVFISEEWLPYIKQIENTFVLFKMSLPFANNLKLGSVIVSNSPSIYISGRIDKIDYEQGNIRVDYNHVQLTDIYDRLIIHKSVFGSTHNQNRMRRVAKDSLVVFNIPPIELTCDIDNMTIKGNAEFDIRMIYTANVLPDTIIAERMKICPTIHTTFDVSLEMSDGDKVKWRSNPPNIIIPIVPGLNAFFQSSVFYEHSISYLSLGINNIVFDYNATHEISRNKQGTWSYKKISEVFDAKQPHPYITANGEVFLGIGTKLGIGVPKFSAVGIDIKSGLFLNINAEFDTKIFSGFDTYLYDALKDNKLNFGGRIELIPYVEGIGKSSEDVFPDFKFVPYNKSFISLHLLPEFEEIGYRVGNDGKLFLRSEASNQLFMPAQIGFALYDSHQNVLGTSKYIDYPQGCPELVFTDIDAFTVNEDEKYICYPIVRLKFGDHYLNTWRASPSVVINKGTNIMIETHDASPFSITSILLKGEKIEDMDYYGFRYWKTSDAYGLNNKYMKEIEATEFNNEFFSTLLTDLDINCEYTYYAFGIRNGIEYKGMKKRMMIEKPSIHVNDVKRIDSDGVFLSGEIEKYNPNLDKEYVYIEYKPHNSMSWASPRAYYSSSDNILSYTINKLAPNLYDYRIVCVFGHDTFYSDTKQFTYPLIPVTITSVTTTSAQYRPTDHPQHFEYKENPYEFKYNVATIVSLTDDTNVENWGYCYEGPENEKTSRISLKGAPYQYEDKRFAYYRNGSPTTHTAKLYPFVKYKDDTEYYYGTPVDYTLAYPETSSIELTACSTPDVVTRTNVEVNGVTYDYCSTFIVDYDATGAYWIGVVADEYGGGWENWDNNLLTHQPAKAMDGSNRLTINYYYNRKVLEGDYLIRLKGIDNTHGIDCHSDSYVRLKHDGYTFTGCELKN